MNEPSGDQRRGRRIAMTPEEIDAFLKQERTCRVATVSSGGAPHVMPMWFVWDGTSLWLNSIVNSQRWADLERDSRVSVVVDAGEDYSELRGVELRGEVRRVGDVPRSAEPHMGLAEPEAAFAVKYQQRATFKPDGRHAWLRLTPAKTVSWDFRKLRT